MESRWLKQSVVDCANIPIIMSILHIGIRTKRHYDKNSKAKMSINCYRSRNK